MKTIFVNKKSEKVPKLYLIKCNIVGIFPTSCIVTFFCLLCTFTVDTMCVDKREVTVYIYFLKYNYLLYLRA